MYSNEPGSDLPLMRLYRLAAQAAGPVPPKVIDAACLAADTFDDQKLMVALAARDDLTPYARQTIAAQPAAEVRAAWLRRRDLTPAERDSALKGEKRATVLAVLAADTVTAPETLDRLAEMTSGKVLKAVITNSATPSPVRAKAVLNWERVVRKPCNNDAWAVKRAIGEDEDCHEQLAVQAQRPATLDILCTSPNLSPQAVARLARLRVVKVIADNIDLATGKTKPGYGTSRYEASSRCQSAVSRAAELVTNPALETEAAEAIREMVELFHSRYLPRQSSTAAVLGSLDRAVNEGLAERLALARNSDDPSVLAGLVADNVDQTVAEAIAYNRAADPATTVAAVDVGITSTLSKRWFTTRAGQHDVLIAVLEAHPSRASQMTVSLDDRPLWEAVMGAKVGASVKLQLLRRALSATGPSKTRLMPRWLAELTPLDVVADLRLYSGDAEIAAALCETFGGRLEAAEAPLELVHHVAESFEGTLDQLVEVAARLVAPARSAS